MNLGLPGGADRPPQPAAPESDFHAAYRRLRELRSCCNHLDEPDIANDVDRAINRTYIRVVRNFKKFGGNSDDLAKRSDDPTVADQRYRTLQEMARQAENDEDLAHAGAIRAALDAIVKHTVEELRALCTKHPTVTAPLTLAMQRPPVTAGPSMSVPAFPWPACAPVNATGSPPTGSCAT